MPVYSPSSVTLQHKMSANLVQIGSHLYNEGSNTNLFFHLSGGDLHYDKSPIMRKNVDLRLVRMCTSSLAMRKTY